MAGSVLGSGQNENIRHFSLLYNYETYAYCFVVRLCEIKYKLWPMPNVMAALPNIGGALCWTPQTFADAHYSSAVQ